jgi:uncharacterized protein
MYTRSHKLHSKNNFFLFGARSTGKSTLVDEKYSSPKTLWINFLKEEDEDRYSGNLKELGQEIATGKYSRVVIDEVQKVPKILDQVHLEIERHPGIQFILTGSSARKLKKDGANLLAGRAFTYSLFPLTHIELGEDFDLNSALTYGTLPKLVSYDDQEDKIEFLRSYVRTYIKEEVQIEQLVRNLTPFKKFLEVAAQSNGKVINYAKISRDVGVDDKTVQNYFSILEDTLLGTLLPAHHKSIRKQQRLAPKFYFFDTGVARALDKTVSMELSTRNYAYGNIFEHWIIIECIRINEYLRKDYTFSYILSKDGAEVDLIIERPGKKDLLVEIKSTEKVGIDDTGHLRNYGNDWPGECALQVWSQDTKEKIVEGVECMYWRDAINSCFG